MLEISSETITVSLERFFATSAFEIALHVLHLVRSLMMFQQGRVYKEFSALVTPNRLFLRVQFLVLFYVFFIRESLPTMRALVELFSSMFLNMGLEMLA